MKQIEQRCGTLAERLHRRLVTQRHENGAPLARVYGDGWRQDGGGGGDGDGKRSLRQGAIVNFNLLRDDGAFIGYIEVADDDRQF